MNQNLKDGLAVKGFDVVGFFNGEATKGSSEYSFEFEGATYNFSSAANRDIFKANPQKHLPQYGGYCAIAMSEGTMADPNPKSFKIQDGNLYLFTRMFWGIIDVQRQWNKAPEEKRKLADAEWTSLK